MPVWHERTKAAREAGDLVVIGLIQEQHPARCRLFMDWKGIDWPILVDSLNRTGVWAVPLVWAIDEHGVLRSTSPKPDWVLGEFLEKEWPAPRAGAATPEIETDPIHALYLAGRYGETIAAAERALAGSATLDALGARRFGELEFALGCAYRARHDSDKRELGDFQKAITAWTHASRRVPRNYIYRRRIQQYGPRLGKPYPFYDWIPAARAALRERGEKIPTLMAEPEGSEYASPLRRFPDAVAGHEEPDPKNEIASDDGLLDFEAVVAPKPVRAGASFRVYLRWTPSAMQRAYFDEEAGPLTVWITPAKGWHTPRNRIEYVASKEQAADKGRGTRVVEFEMRLARDVEPGPQKLRGYLLANVCEDKNGICRYVRKDFEIDVPVDKPKPQRRRRR